MKELQINGQIRDREVRLLGADKELIGIMSAAEAQRIADEKKLDLVKIAPDATPPVCRIMDYGKYRYEQTKKEKENRQKQKIVEIKEVQLSATIDVGDVAIKAKAATKFLSQGNKVLVTLRLKGRQMQHQDLALKVMLDFFELLKDICIQEKAPVINGRNISMVLAPPTAIKK